MLLLTNYKDASEYIEFPCILQRKIDGVRCLVRNGKGISRSGKELLNISHLGLGSVQLDGELYSNGLSLGELSGLLQKKVLNASDRRKIGQIKLYVFDIRMPGPFRDRLQRLETLKKENTNKCIVFLENFLCESRDKAIELAESFIKEGEEGAVFRNLTGMYVSDRTKNVQKYKPRYDDEFTIVRTEMRERNRTGVVILQTKQLFTFRVPVYSCNEPLEPQSQATIEFLSVDPNTGIPREATFKCIRH